MQRDQLGRFISPTGKPPRRKSRPRTPEEDAEMAMASVHANSSKDLDVLMVGSNKAVATARKVASVLSWIKTTNTDEKA